MRQLFRASGAALLAPGTVACALIVLAFAGGFSQLGSLRQALSGPAAPPPATAGPAGTGPTLRTTGLGSALTTLSAVTASLPAGTGSAGTRAGRGTARSGGTSGRGRGRGGSTGSGNGGSGSRGSGGRTGGSGAGSGGSGGRGSGRGGPGGSGGGSSGGGAAGAPSQTPTVVDGIITIVSGVTAKLPGPLGSGTTSALKSLGSTVDRVLPIKIGLGALSLRQGSSPSGSVL
jgi:hypothetical protein